MAVDFKSLGKNDQGALIAGGIAIIVSFIGSYVTVSYDGPASDVLGGFSGGGSNAWTSYATLGMLLIVAAIAVVGVKAFAAENLPDGVPWNLAAAAAAGLGTLLLILRAISYGGGSELAGISVGPGWSAFVLWIACIALTVFAVLSFKSSGEKIPEMKKKDTPPAPPAPPAA